MQFKIIKSFIIIFFFITFLTFQDKLYSNSSSEKIEDFGIISLMYHRFEENKYPSTNIRINDFKKHIEIIDPKILVLLGTTALNAIIGDQLVISKARGQWIEKKIGASKMSVIVTFHPAFLMRQPAQKKMAWIDLKMIREKKSKLRI